MRRTLKRVRGGGWGFDRTKLPRSCRSLAIPKGLVELLLAHRDVHAPGEHGLVFASEAGEPLHSDNLSRRSYKRVLERAGLSRDFRLYDLRHTCATLLLVAGVHPKVVSEQLGHSSIRETMDTYSHVVASLQEEASEALDAMLFQDGELPLYN